MYKTYEEAKPAAFLRLLKTLAAETDEDYIPSEEMILFRDLASQVATEPHSTTEKELAVFMREHQRRASEKKRASAPTEPSHFVCPFSSAPEPAVAADEAKVI